MSKITKIYKYGIELTKPWSSEMYKFNEDLSESMIDQITSVVNDLESEKQAQAVANIINPYSYGKGFNLSNMKQDMLNNIECFEKWWLNEVWQDLIDNGIVDPILDKLNQDLRIIGFEGAEEIKFLREIHGPLNTNK